MYLFARSRRKYAESRDYIIILHYDRDSNYIAIIDTEHMKTVCFFLNTFLIDH